MQAYDILMLVILVGAVVWGAWKGLAWQLASIASMVLSYFVAFSFRAPLAKLINASPPWNVFVSMLILFLGTSLVVWIGFNLVAELIEKVKLREFDRQVGALFGFAKGVLLCVLITLFAVTLLSEPQRQAICNSKSGYYIAILLDKASGVIPGEVHQVLEPYMDRLDAQIPHEHTAGAPLRIPTTMTAESPTTEGGVWQWAQGFFGPGGIFGKSGSPPAPEPARLPELPGFGTGNNVIEARPASGSFDPQMADRPASSPIPARQQNDLRRW
ncbi:MAG: CvpA family protein [Pirellulaceae bacterium]|nr:CvpA family protein [Pirellulaceae bacterium]